MLLTDTEWLRFVSFAMVAGGVLGGANTAALLVDGWPLNYALVAGVAFTAAVALIVHAIVRYLLDTAAEREPPADTEGDADAEVSEA